MAHYTTKARKGLYILATCMALGLWSTNSQAQTLSPGKQVITAPQIVCAEPIGIMNAMDDLAKDKEAGNVSLRELYALGVCQFNPGTSPEVEIKRIIKSVKPETMPATFILYEANYNDRTFYLVVASLENAS